MNRLIWLAFLLPIMASAQWELEEEFISGPGLAFLNRSTAQYVAYDSGNSTTILYDRISESHIEIPFADHNIKVNANGDILFENSYKIWDNTLGMLSDIGRGPVECVVEPAERRLNDDRSFGWKSKTKLCATRLPQTTVVVQSFPTITELGGQGLSDLSGRFFLTPRGVSTSWFTRDVDGLETQLNSADVWSISFGGAAAGPSTDGFCYWAVGAGEPDVCATLFGRRGTRSVSNNGEVVLDFGSSLGWLYRSADGTNENILPGFNAAYTSSINYGSDFGRYFSYSTVPGLINAVGFYLYDAPDVLLTVLDDSDARLTLGSLEVIIAADNGDLVVRQTRLDGTDTVRIYSASFIFFDVQPDFWAFSFVEAIAQAGITAGCGRNNYCPEDLVTRAQIAVFLERAMNGSDFVPPPASGAIFNDVAAGSFASNFIEQFYADGITAGCGNSNYCPEAAVSRAQMAVFLLRAKYGSAYSPPAPSGVFADVDLGHWAAAWIEQLAVEGITAGCGNGNYCPDAEVTRDQMAVFLVRTFGL